VRSAEGAAAIGYEALKEPEGQAIIREFSTSSTMIGALRVGRGFFAAHSRCATETVANWSWRQAIAFI
jgi:hypothetical protein